LCALEDFPRLIGKKISANCLSAWKDPRIGFNRNRININSAHDIMTGESSAQGQTAHSTKAVENIQIAHFRIVIGTAIRLQVICASAFSSEVRLKLGENDSEAKKMLELGERGFDFANFILICFVLRWKGSVAGRKWQGPFDQVYIGV